MMERRGHERYQIQFEARVTVAGDQRHAALGCVSDISKSGISVGLPFQLAAGDLVEVEIADSILHGQVVYSSPDESSFRTGIAASRIVLGATDLSSLLQSILIEALPEMPGLETSETHGG